MEKERDPYDELAEKLDRLGDEAKATKKHPVLAAVAGIATLFATCLADVLAIWGVMAIAGLPRTGIGYAALVYLCVCWLYASITGKFNA